jgi:hypothetical protein
VNESANLTAGFRNNYITNAVAFRNNYITTAMAYGNESLLSEKNSKIAFCYL